MMAKPVTGRRSGTSAATTIHGWRRMAFKGMVAIFVLVVLAGLIYYAYNQGKEAGGGNTPPIIKAGPAPYKVRPDRPGGMQVLNRDKQIFSQFDSTPKPPVVERLLPPAETPMAPKAIPPVARSAPPKVAKPGLSSTGQRGPKNNMSTTPPEKAAAQPDKSVAVATSHPMSKSASAAGGDYKVQLASLRSKSAVVQSWDRLVTSNKDLLGELRLTITRRDFGSAKGVFFRMQAGPLPNAVAARDLCARLKHRKLNCLVIQR